MANFESTDFDLEIENLLQNDNNIHYESLQYDESNDRGITNLIPSSSYRHKLTQARLLDSELSTVGDDVDTICRTTETDLCIDVAEEFEQDLKDLNFDHLNDDYEENIINLIDEDIKDISKWRENRNQFNNYIISSNMKNENSWTIRNILDNIISDVMDRERQSSIITDSNMIENIERIEVANLNNLRNVKTEFESESRLNQYRSQNYSRNIDLKIVLANQNCFNSSLENQEKSIESLLKYANDVDELLSSMN